MPHSNNGRLPVGARVKLAIPPSINAQPFYDVHYQHLSVRVRNGAWGTLRYLKTGGELMVRFEYLDIDIKLPDAWVVEVSKDDLCEYTGELRYHSDEARHAEQVETSPIAYRKRKSRAKAKLNAA